MNPTSSPAVVSLTERRAAKRDRVASAGRADALAEAVIPDHGLTALLAEIMDGQPVEPRNGDRVSHSQVQDWLELLLSRPKVADLAQDEQQNGPWEKPPELHVAGRTGPAPTRGSVSHLGQLAPQLIDELERITLPFSDQAPSDAELNIAQTQLDDWLEQLSHDLQAELFALQMAAQQQLLNIANLAAATARHRAVNASPDGPSQGDAGMPEPARISQN